MDDLQKKKMLIGTISKEMEVKVAAAEAWKIYGTLKFIELIVEKLPDFIQKFELLEGDGGVGTVLKATFPPGKQGPPYLIEKFIVVDDEKRVKIGELIEGGQFALGFTQFLVHLQVLEKDEDSCITKIKVEYEIGEDLSNKVSLANAMPFGAIMNVVADTLIKSKKNV